MSSVKMAYIEKRLNLPSSRIYGEARHQNFSQALLKISRQRGWRFDPRRIVHVVGTNGKGTTAQALARFLSCAGFRVGLFTSPHLESIFERIRINAENISPPEFIQSFEGVEAVADEFGLVHFEVLTLMAMEHFFCGSVDYIILEAGVGARFDPTGAIPHHWTALTTIGYDHVQLLGPSLADISKHKLGAVQVGTEIIHLAARNAEVQAAWLEARRTVFARWTEVPWPEARPSASIPWPKWEMHWRGIWYPMQMVGEHAAANLALAATLFAHITGQRFEPAWFSEVLWPGRFEHLIASDGDWILSGDHNPEGMQALDQVLHFYPCDWIAVIGLSGQKDMADFFEPLVHPFAEIHLCPSSYKPIEMSSLDLAKEILLEKNITNKLMIWTSWQEAIAAAEATQRQTRKTILVSGSLYLVGCVRAMLSKRNQVISTESQGPPSTSELLL